MPIYSSGVRIAAVARRSSYWWLALAILAGPPDARSAPAVERESTEYQIKAAFVLNFTQFVEWPATVFARRDAPFIIGVLGENPFGALLHAAVKDERVGGRPLIVKEIGAEAEIAKCHVLFVSRSEHLRMRELLGRLRTAPILTIGETDRFCEAGGIINLTVQDKTVHFEMNPRAAIVAGLQVSAKLLTLAKTVSTEGSPAPGPP